MLILFFIFILIAKFNSNEIELKKLSKGNNEYNPYTFTFTLNDNQSIYPAIFDTTQSYILMSDENEKEENFLDNYYSKCYYLNDSKGIKECEIIIRNQTTSFYYFLSKEKISDKGILGIIGLSNINRHSINNKNKGHNYSSLSILQEQINFTNYINFIQKEDDEAIMNFGDKDSSFTKGHSRKCKCKDKFWSCELISLKIGGEEIYSQTILQEFAIFSISDEYIIAPKKQGEDTLDYYKTKIKELFGIECHKTFGEDNYSVFICNYFNYEDLPDLSFVMKGGIQIMALSIDLFKIIKDYKLELKIKHYKYQLLLKIIIYY